MINWMTGIDQINDYLDESIQNGNVDGINEVIDRLKATAAYNTGYEAMILEKAYAALDTLV